MTSKATTVHSCPNCNRQLQPVSCKLRCPCGYFESCSDLEPAPPTKKEKP